MISIEAAVVGDDAISLALLCHFRDAGWYATLVAFQSVVAEQVRWTGIKLTGSLTATVDRTEIAVCEDNLSDLPERAFDYLFFSGNNGVATFLENLPATPTLIGPGTKIIALQDPLTYEVLLRHFPGQVFQAWVFGNWEMPQPQSEPTWVHAQLRIVFEYDSDTAFLVAQALSEVLTKSGLECVPVHTSRVQRATAAAQSLTGTITLKTLFVDLQEAAPQP